MSNPSRRSMEEELNQKAAPSTPEQRAEIAAGLERNIMLYEEKKARALAAELADQMNEFVGRDQWLVLEPQTLSDAVSVAYGTHALNPDPREVRRDAILAAFREEPLSKREALELYEELAETIAEHADWLDNNRTMEDARY